jgi:hypothetical protein
MNSPNEFDTLQLKEKIQSLQDCIINAHPRLPILLKEIHTILKNDPANVTVLGEEEIAAIISGLKKQTATEITQSTLKKTKASLSKTTLADL